MTAKTGRLSVQDKNYSNLPRIEIHTTDRTTFKNCRQAWDFASHMRMNLEPITPYEPFWFGTAIHDCIAKWYTLKDEDVVYELFVEHIEAWFKSLTRYDEDGEKIAEPTEEDYEKKTELGNMGLAMLEQYILFSKNEDDFEPVWIERAWQLFEIKLPDGRTVDYSFRCDGVVKDEHGRYWILEHKTCASFPGDTDYLMMDDQVGTYLWALEQILGVKIEGVIYNYIKKKQPRELKRNQNGMFSLDKRQDTTYAIAKRQMLADYPNAQGMPNEYRDFLDFLYHKENNFVRREKVRRNAKEIKLIGEALPFEIVEMIDDPSIYRSPSRLCNNCPFFDPCLLRWEGGDWQELLENNYKQREGR